MSNLELKDPAYLFEVSWEVCNKVGGNSHGNFNKGVEFGRGIQKQPYIDWPGRVAV